MKNLTIFTDPHLGTSRAAHTTRASSAALKMSLYWQAMGIVRTAENPVMCVGDLFDKAFNNEETLVQGYNVASRCWHTLSGNHDETNREGTTTSLRALAKMGVPICLAEDLSKPYFDHCESIYMVPHHASQELFMEACNLAASHAALNREGKASYLFLHCNYNFDLAKDDNTLNLPAEDAEALLAAFDYIFIGHEHNPYTALGGRVVILGNTHPTSFHDVSDKFIYHLELDTATLTKERIWSKDEGYREVKLGDPIPDLSGVQFVDVVGNGSISEATEVSAYIHEIWKASFYKPEGEDNHSECDLFAVRNKVELNDALAGLDTEISVNTPETLQERILKDLTGTDLLPIFKGLYAEATE